uniref:Uncharacterized protein n=1 Tax=Solanum tuberosum TaxID=4113 RepID=M1DP48_SOLTU
MIPPLDHHPTNGSASSYQWIINEASSSYQWINIFLPMDQYRPTNGSSTKHHHPINGASTSSGRWIINHYPIKGASTSSSYHVAALSYQWIIIMLSMKHRHPYHSKSSSTASKPMEADVKTFIEKNIC